MRFDPTNLEQNTEKTHGNGGLAAAGADIPDEVASRSLGGNELEELRWVTWPCFRVLFRLLCEQFRHFSLANLYALSFFFSAIGNAQMGWPSFLPIYRIILKGRHLMSVLHVLLELGRR